MSIKLQIPAALAAALFLLAGCAASGGKPPAANAGEPVSSSQADKPGTAGNGEPESETDPVFALMAAEFTLQQGEVAEAARWFARAAELSDDVAVAERAVRVATYAKDWDSARRATRRWRTLDADSPGPLQSEATLALNDNDQVQAEKSLVTLIESHADDGWRLAGQVLLTTEHPEVASAVLDRLASHPQLFESGTALIAFSQLAQRLERPEQALVWADRAVDADPKSTQALTWRGQLRLARGNSEGALADFRAAAQMEPANEQLRLGIAGLLHEAGRFREAQQELASLPASDEILAQRAAYAAESEDKQAIDTIYSALAALDEPHPDDRLYLLGQLAELREDRAAARSWYQKIGRGERYPQNIFRIAVLDAEDGQLDLARAGAQAVQKETGLERESRIDAYLLEGELIIRHGNRADAPAVYAAGLSAFPDSTELLYGRALLAEQMDDIVQAEADLRAIVERKPEDAQAWNALGYTLADRTDRYEEAQGYIEKALAMEPESGAILDSMGWVLFRRGKHAEALDYLQKAYAAQPDGEIAAHLGEVLWVLGRRDEATAMWEKALAEDPEHEAVLETMKRLMP